MAEANAPAASNAAATEGNAPAASNAEAAKQNAEAASARKAFEAEKAKLVEAHTLELAKRDEKLAEIKGQFKGERDWRLGVLDTRAKSVGVTETAMRLARAAGPEEYEKLIGELEATKTPKQEPKPAAQPGGLVGGEEIAGIDLDAIDPLKNGGRIQPLYDAYAKHGKAKVEAALAKGK